MAGSTYTINFDTGIEKVEYSESLVDFPSGEVTSSGQTVGGAIELYVRPIFKQGYELDSTNAVLTDTNGIYACRKDNINITNVTFTSKQSTPTLTFKHFYDAGTIGTGTIKFRHYSQQEPSSGETWVLNEEVSFDLLKVNIDFTSNNERFKSISSTSSGKFEKYLTYNRVDGYALLACKYTSSGYSWDYGEAYRTITFATTPTGDLLTWLQANGTKQGGGGK